MKITITVNELMNRGLWLQACRLLGIDEYAVNEGRLHMETTLELTEEQAKELGLISS